MMQYSIWGPTLTRLVLLAGCFAAATWANHPNVLLITIDTLRADHLSCYGYGWNTSPNIDKLAREGTRFERAYTVIPLTGPAHLSLFTSRYPQEHGAVRNGLAMAGDRALVALPQILRANRYQTAAFVSAWPLIGRLTRIDQWFDHYDETLTRKYQLFNSARWAEDVTPPAIEWLRRNTKKNNPFFMWVHYFDPHSPYDLREHFMDLQENRSKRTVAVRDEAMRERVKNYDTEIAYTDWYLGKLLAALDELKVKDSTLVVLTADHGESLGEHKYIGHGRHLYENIIRVPLIVRFPGVVNKGQVISTPVSILDIAPTITDLTVRDSIAQKTVRDSIAQKKVALTFGGRSLADALTDAKTLTRRRIYNVTFPGKKGFAPRWLSWMWIDSENQPLRFGYVDGATKLIWSPGEELLHSYDVARDPREHQPATLAATSPPYAAETERLKNWYSRTESKAGEELLSKRDIEVLKSLGYVQ